MLKGTCPSCDNTLRTTEGAPINFCIHCGLKIYEPCPGCGTRRLVFFPFCMVCGAPAEAPHRGGPAGGAQVSGVSTGSPAK